MKNIFYVLMLVISCKYGSDSYTATSNDNGITIDTLFLDATMVETGGGKQPGITGIRNSTQELTSSV